MTEDEKENEYMKNAIPGCLTYLILVTILGAFAYNATKARMLRDTHDLFKPIPRISAYEDSLVYSIGDSLLDARKARYDALRQDYYFTFDKMHELCRSWPFIGFFRTDFDKAPVTPEYAKQIGAKNLVQYDRYLDRYERDSLAPAYKNVYNKKVIPMIRNGVRAK